VAWLTQAFKRSDFSVSYELMEVRPSRPSKDAAQAERRAVIVELWVQMRKPPVDARVLKTIQARLTEVVENDELGPAAIARMLADEGAQLKHPELIETDAAWRQVRIETDGSEFERLSSPQVMTVSTADNFIDELEQLRKQYELDDERQRLAQVRAIGSESRRLAESIARNRSVEKSARVEQAEIAEWLKVWLQTPALFKDWLELRRRSEEFRARFPRLHHEDTKTQSD
jgi:hypothetical protein